MRGTGVEVTTHWASHIYADNIFLLLSPFQFREFFFRQELATLVDRILEIPFGLFIFEGAGDYFQIFFFFLSKEEEMSVCPYLVLLLIPLDYY